MNPSTLVNRGRRRFLADLTKGMTLGSGAVVLQPMLRSIAAQAAGGEGPLRIVFFVESNGLLASHNQPSGIDRRGDDRAGGADRLLDVSLADHDLHDTMAALAPFKDRMTIIQDLSGKIARDADHSTEYGALGCYKVAQGAPSAQTIDHAVAQSLTGVIPVVGLGVHPDPATAVSYGISAMGPGRAMPVQCHPDLAFQSLFGSVAGGDGAKAVALRRNLFDYMSQDIRRVRSALAGPERASLDVYLEAYESLRDRQDKVAALSDRMKANLPNTAAFGSDVVTDRLEAQCELAAAVLASGLTNVMLIDAGGGGRHFSYKSLGIPIDTHAIGHLSGADGKTPTELRAIIRRFHCERIAALATKLASIKEGSGTVLDRTLIVNLSDAAEEHHPQAEIWPVVLLGNLGGRLKTGGRLLQFPRYGRAGHRTMANLYLTLLHAVGDRRESFGTPDPALDGVDQAGPLAELLG